LRCDRASEEVAVGIVRRANRDMPIGVDDAVLREDSIGRNQVFEKFHQSALIPAALTTRVQRASSSLTRSPSACGAPPPGTSPCFSSTSRTSASWRKSFISPFSRATIGAGVPAGAKRAYQV